LFDRGKPEDEQASQADWLAERARVASFLFRARTFAGTGPEDPTLKIKLRPDERALLVATGTYLIEPKRLKAYWKGAPGGLSFAGTRVTGPGAGLESVSDRGLGPLDTGDLTFTTQRVVFSGSNQTREWEYSKLVGFENVDRPPSTTIGTSDHPRLAGFLYDFGQADEIRFAIVIGVARFTGQLDSLIADLQSQLDEIDRDHPEARPAAVAPAGAPTPAPTQLQDSSPAAGPAAAGIPSPPPTPTPTPAPTPAPAAAGEESQAGFASATPEPATPEPAASPTSVEPPSPGPTTAGVEDSSEGGSAPEPDTILPSSPPLNWGSGADLGPTVTSLSPAAGQAGSATDEPVPTGEMPQVNSPPTATYPAVAQQPAAQGGQYAQARAQYEQTGGQYAQAGAAQQPQAQGSAQTGGAQMPPGWYPDPWRIARVRWWDGYAWTAYTSH
jgi:hypothetical protein